MHGAPASPCDGCGGSVGSHTRKRFSSLMCMTQGFFVAIHLNDEYAGGDLTTNGQSPHCTRAQGPQVPACSGAIAAGNAQTDCMLVCLVGLCARTTRESSNIGWLRLFGGDHLTRCLGGAPERTPAMDAARPVARRVLRRHVPARAGQPVKTVGDASQPRTTKHTREVC